MCYNLFVIVQSKYGRVAQLGERTVRIRKVEGSIPFMSTSFVREVSWETSLIFLLHQRKSRGAMQIAPRLFSQIKCRICLPDQSAKKRWRKVTIWPRVQGASGLKVVAEVPEVMPSL